MLTPTPVMFLIDGGRQLNNLGARILNEFSRIVVTFDEHVLAVVNLGTIRYLPRLSLFLTVILFVARFGARPSIMFQV